MVLTSESSHPTEVLSGIKMGAVEFLEKPVGLAKLRTIWQHTRKGQPGGSASMPVPVSSSRTRASRRSRKLPRTSGGRYSPDSFELGLLHGGGGGDSGSLSSTTENGGFNMDLDLDLDLEASSSKHLCRGPHDDLDSQGFLVDSTETLFRGYGDHLVVPGVGRAAPLMPSDMQQQQHAQHEALGSHGGSLQQQASGTNALVGRQGSLPQPALSRCPSPNPTPMMPILSSSPPLPLPAMGARNAWPASSMGSMAMGAATCSAAGPPLHPSDRPVRILVLGHSAGMLPPLPNVPGMVWGLPTNPLQLGPPKCPPLSLPPGMPGMPWATAGMMPCATKMQRGMHHASAPRANKHSVHGAAQQGGQQRPGPKAVPASSPGSPHARVPKHSSASGLLPAPQPAPKHAAPAPPAATAAATTAPAALPAPPCPSPRPAGVQPQAPAPPPPSCAPHVGAAYATAPSMPAVLPATAAPGAPATADQCLPPLPPLPDFPMLSFPGGSCFDPMDMESLQPCDLLLLMLEDGPGARGAGGVRGGLSRPSSFMNLMSLGHAAGAGGCQLLAQEAS